MSSSGQKPGVMIYFDIMDPMEILDMEQRGQLLTAILSYSKEGTMPDFGGDKLLMMAWSMVQKSIDRDDESYKQTILRRRYASYCNWEKDAGRVPVSFEEWLNSIEGFPGFSCTDDPVTCNLQIYFCTQDDMTVLLGPDFAYMDGGVTFWYND